MDNYISQITNRIHFINLYYSPHRDNNFIAEIDYGSKRYRSFYRQGRQSVVCYHLWIIKSANKILKDDIDIGDVQSSTFFCERGKISSWKLKKKKRFHLDSLSLSSDRSTRENALFRTTKVRTFDQNRKTRLIPSNEFSSFLCIFN